MKTLKVCQTFRVWRSSDAVHSETPPTRLAGLLPTTLDQTLPVGSVGTTDQDLGSLPPGLVRANKIFPAWHSAQELIDYAKECCVVRELTVEEREQFGLPSR